MNELIILDSQLPQNIEQHQHQVTIINKSGFPQDTKNILLAAVAVRFCMLTPEEKIAFITLELENAYKRVGVTKNDEGDKAFTIAEIVELFDAEKHITHKEISELMKRGSLGLLGKYYGINVKSISDWINEYFKDEKRKIAINKLNELLKAQERLKEMTPVESKEFIKLSIKEIYTERRENSMVGTEMLSYPLYDYLKVNGYIKLTEAEKAYLLEEAESILKQNLISISGGSKKNEILQQFKNNEIDITKMAKVLAVRDYMNELMESGKEIEL